MKPIRHQKGTEPHQIQFLRILLKVHGPKKTGQRQTQGNVNYIYCYEHNFLRLDNIKSSESTISLPYLGLKPNYLFIGL